MPNAQKKEKKFPVFDLVLILLVALAIAGGVFWVMNRQQVREQDVVYTVRFEGIGNDYTGLFTEGKTVYSTEGVSVGTITAVTVSRSVTRTFDRTPTVDRGQYAYREIRSQDNSDLLVTVRVKAEGKSGGYFIGNLRLAAGITLRAVVGGFEAEGTILALTPQEEAAS